MSAITHCYYNTANDDIFARPAYKHLLGRSIPVNGNINAALLKRLGANLPFNERKTLNKVFTSVMEDQSNKDGHVHNVIGCPNYIVYELKYLAARGKLKLATVIVSSDKTKFWLMTKPSKVHNLTW